MSESPADLASTLKAENEILRQRIEAASAQIHELRAQAVVRQEEIRALAAQLPERVSRRGVITEMARNLLRKRP